jgi:hypothetical protein
MLTDRRWEMLQLKLKLREVKWWHHEKEQVNNGVHIFDEGRVVVAASILVVALISNYDV